MKRGLAGFWYRFKNWFRTKPGPGEPLTFLCGSEEELQRVTTWVCHAYSQVFQNSDKVTVTYTGKGGQDSEGIGKPFGSPFQLEDAFEECTLTDAELGLMWIWLTKVFEANAFIGTGWHFTDHYMRQELGEARYIIQRLPGCILHRASLPCLLGLYEFGNSIFVEVPRPSFHERAEALFSLSEWLDGKVSEEEKRELLGLCD